MSKGSRARPLSVPLNEFNNSFENIFGKKEPKPRWVPPPLPTEEKETPNQEKTLDKE